MGASCHRRILETSAVGAANALEAVGREGMARVTARPASNGLTACASRMAIRPTQNAQTAMEATDQEAMEGVAAAMAAGEEEVVVVVTMAAGEVMVAMVEVAAEVVAADAHPARLGRPSPLALARWK